MNRNFAPSHKQKKKQKQQQDYPVPQLDNGSMTFTVDSIVHFRSQEVWGTPNNGSSVEFCDGSYNSHGSHRSSRRFNVCNRRHENESSVENSNVTLVATRPLLKALAQQCRPSPPWCVGFAVPEGTTEELRMFASFLRATPDELSSSAFAVQFATEIMQTVWPDVEMKPMSTTAAGLSPQKGVTLHYYAANSHLGLDQLGNIQTRIQAVANDRGAQVEFSTDYRKMTCVVINDIRSGKRLSVRHGEHVSKIEIASDLFRKTVLSNEHYRAVLTLLDALLRQNKMLDDTGTDKKAISGEALVTMLVSIINSYGPSDTPDAGRLLMDFFLTFGFTANFDLVANSVSVSGMGRPRAKVHRNAELSVLDPADETQNLTQWLEKAANLQAVFNYCYTALTQYVQVSQRQRRAQSILSTIIGGEAYWSRVLQLYREGISPFLDVVNAKKNILLRAL